MPGRERHLTLLLPGLFRAPVVGDLGGLLGDLSVDKLERLLSRAEPGSFRSAEDTPEGMLFSLFGVETPVGGDLPVAAVTRYLDTGERDEAWYLRADPVHLRADINTLILFDADTFSLARPEAEALAAELAPALEHGAGGLAVGHPGRWYLRLSRSPALRTHGIREVSGQDVNRYLPAGEQGPEWRRLLNELQMLLHASPVNRAREDRGEVPVNSVWFWGGGSLPPAPAKRWAQVWGDDDLLLGLARLAGSPRTGGPAGASEWLDQALTPGQHLVYIDSLDHHVRYGDLESWLAGLVRVEQDWFAPLTDALARRGLGSLTLIGGPAGSLRLTPGAGRRWWRRTRPFASFLS